MSSIHVECPFKDGKKEQPNACIAKKKTSVELMKMESEFAAHNYHPLPVVFERAKGASVWDPEGKHYYDFLSAYSAVNQGHCHPKIIQALIDQSQKATLSSRAFYNSVFPRFAEYVTDYFGYDMVLPMNGGAEAVETAMKLARKWGYMKKGIAQDQAIIISAAGCFHGRTLAIVSMSDDPDCRKDFGPFLPGVMKIEYDDVDALRQVLETHGHNIAGFLVEPIQGEAGVRVPAQGYLTQCKELCQKHNVLFIADEIQTGLCRTGKLLCCDHEDLRPDIVILGKAISGGVLPLSCVLADKPIMLCIQPGEHGSTYGGNPLAAAVGIAALEVLKEEKLADRAAVLGERLRNGLIALNSPSIELVRGKGLLNAVIIDESHGETAWDICIKMKDRGLLAKPTHGNIIRLAPPLVITEQEIDKCLAIISDVLARPVDA